MKDLKKFLLKTFSSKSDVSSKRLISFLAFGMMTIGFLSNLYFGFKVEEHMFKSMEWIVEIGMGTILLERFSGKKEEEKKEEPTTSGDTQTQSVDMSTGVDPVE
jgi:hypothetical protein